MSTYTDYVLCVSERCTRMDWMSNEQVRVHQYSIRNFSIYTFFYGKCLQSMERCFLVSLTAVVGKFECQRSSDKIADWHAKIVIENMSVKEEDEVREVTLRVPLVCIYLLFWVVISLLLIDEDWQLFILKETYNKQYNKSI